MNKLILTPVLLLLFGAATAQVQMDKAIQLTGTGTDAKISGIKNVTAAQDALSVEAFQKGSFTYGGTTAGSSTAYTVALNPAIAAYSPGMMLYFKAHTANGAGPVTINVNGVGAVAIKKGGAIDLAAGDISNGQVACVIYDGTNFYLVSAADGSSTNELQTISASGTGNIDLSNSGGTVTLQGTGATNVSRSGNTITINSIDNNSGGTVTGTGVATRVAFWSGTSALSSNSSLYWDNANNRLGIGTDGPDHPLSVVSTSSPQLRINNPNSTAGTTAGIRFNTGNGWDVQLRTNQGTSWLELTSNAGQVFQRWDSDRYYPGNSSAYITTGGSDVVVGGGNLKVNNTAGTGYRLVFADAVGNIVTPVFTSTANADAAGVPAGTYTFNFAGSTGAQQLYYQPGMDGGVGYVKVFSSPFGLAATVNFVDYSFPFTKFLIQNSTASIRATAYFAASRLFNNSSSTVVSNGGTHNGYRVFIGQAGGMGIYNTSQLPCNWANSVSAVGAGYDGSCGTFPNAMRWGTGNSGSPNYSMVGGIWEVWIAN